MDALVPVGLVVQSQGGKHSQFDPGGVAIFLYRSDDLDRTLGFLFLVEGLDNFSKRSLTEQFYDVI